MRSFSVRALSCALSMAAATTVSAQTYDVQPAAYGQGIAQPSLVYAAPTVAEPGPPPIPSPSDHSALNNNSRAMADCGWADDTSSSCDTCDNNSCYDNSCLWFGSVAGLVMSRNNANAFWTSYETNNNVNQVLNTRDANADWNGGAEIRFGRWFSNDCCECGDCCNCTRSGIEASYFTLGHWTGFASVRGDSLPGGTVSTPINLDTQFGPVLIGGDPASDFFDSATEHRIWRDNEVHNVEINFLTQQWLISGSGQITWLAGVRWFRFDDSLIFGSVADGSEFGDDVAPNVNGAAEAYLSSRAVNDLVGFQIGMRADYFLTPGLGVYVTPKIGIYGNNVSVRNRFYLGDGTEGFDITGHEVDFSMLAQIDVGLEYMLNDNWRLFGGYRAMAVTQVALSDNQFLPYLADTQGFAEPKTNGSLILHGAMMGLEYRF